MMVKLIKTHQPLLPISCNFLIATVIPGINNARLVMALTGPVLSRGGPSATSTIVAGIETRTQKNTGIPILGPFLPQQLFVLLN